MHFQMVGRPLAVTMILVTVDLLQLLFRESLSYFLMQYPRLKMTSFIFQKISRCHIVHAYWCCVKKIKNFGSVIYMYNFISV